MIIIIIIIIITIITITIIVIIITAGALESAREQFVGVCLLLEPSEKFRTVGAHAKRHCKVHAKYWLWTVEVFLFDDGAWVPLLKNLLLKNRLQDNRH